MKRRNKLKKIKLGRPELELAKTISNQVWEKYDDDYGYRSEKQNHNNSVSTELPDNIWFFWGQFDGNNQEEFFDKVLNSQEAGATKLKIWAGQQINKTREARLSLLIATGIDL